MKHAADHVKVLQLAAEVLREEGTHIMYSDMVLNEGS